MCVAQTGWNEVNTKRLLGVVGLVLWAPVVGGEEVRVGDWVWSVDDPGTFYAGTEHPGNEALMQLCDTEDGACFYAVSFGTRCQKDETYHALVNSDAGNGSTELLCGAEVQGSNLLFVQDFETIDGLVRKAHRIGFALPMQGDDIKTVRFSLKGSVAAIDAMRRALARAAPMQSGAKKVREVETL